MTQYVICALQMEGFHCWPEADGELAYLKNSHRHIFFITAEFPVRNANREIEIISQQNTIKRYLLSKYGDEDGACHFGRRSCEDIAAEILNQFENSTSCTVLEDGFDVHGTARDKVNHPPLQLCRTTGIQAPQRTGFRGIYGIQRSAFGRSAFG